MMNNPMQFLDVAHEKEALLDMYSDQVPNEQQNIYSKYTIYAVDMSQ